MRQSLLQYIEIETGSILINYVIRESQIDCIVAYAQARLQFMRLIGIFGLKINGKHIFEDDENKNFTFNSTLLEAVKVGHVDAIQFLLELGANIDGALFEAVMVCHIESAQFLLELGGNIDDALLEAAKYGHSGAVCLLLKLGASINHHNKEGKTPLMLATLGEHEQVVQSLVLAGADVYIQDNNNYTALTVACEMNSYTLCNYLLQQRKVHETAFIAACRHVCSNVICLLQCIKSHITINSSDKILADIQVLDQKFGSLISNIKEQFYTIPIQTAVASQDQMQKMMKDLLQKEHYPLQVVSKDCLPQVAAEMFSKKLISQSVKDDPTYDAILYHPEQKNEIPNCHLQKTSSIQFRTLEGEDQVHCSLEASSKRFNITKPQQGKPV